MRLHVAAIGQRLPAWINEGFQEYQKRFPKEMPLILHEIAAIKRTKNSVASHCIEKESRLLREAVDDRSQVVLLDLKGEIWSTEALALQINQWQQKGQDIYFLIGGADGVDKSCREHAHQTWSLSRLTLPHPLIRIILAEQLYRALMILKHHPYHRSSKP